MAKKVKEVIALLKENGWEEVRIRGDHHIFFKKGAKRPVVVPGNLNDDMKEGTYHSVLRGAGLK